jgi:hypothetical protein
MTKVKLKPEWVFDYPDAEHATINDLLDKGEWHRVVRTRTKCGLKIRLDWMFNIPHKNYQGPAKERRCQKCEAKS